MLRAIVMYTLSRTALDTFVECARQKICDEQKYEKRIANGIVFNVVAMFQLSRLWPPPQQQKQKQLLSNEALEIDMHS